MRRVGKAEAKQLPRLDHTRWTGRHQEQGVPGPGLLAVPPLCALQESMKTLACSQAGLRPGWLFDERPLRASVQKANAVWCGSIAVVASSPTYRIEPEMERWVRLG